MYIHVCWILRSNPRHILYILCDYYLSFCMRPHRTGGRLVVVRHRWIKMCGWHTGDWICVQREFQYFLCRTGDDDGTLTILSAHKLAKCDCDKGKILSATQVIVLLHGLCSRCRSHRTMGTTNAIHFCFGKMVRKKSLTNVRGIP